MKFFLEIVSIILLFGSSSQYFLSGMTGAKVVNRPDGWKCENNFVCRSKQCVCGLCGGQRGAGKPCSYDSLCRSNVCQPYGQPGTCTGRCIGDGTSVGGKAEGSRCGSSRECASKTCMIGRCAKNWQSWNPQTGPHWGRLGAGRNGDVPEESSEGLNENKVDGIQKDNNADDSMGFEKFFDKMQDLDDQDEKDASENFEDSDDVVEDDDESILPEQIINQD